MAIIGNRISTSQFDYHKEAQLFAQDASSLRGTRFLGRLYDDAADTGFVLVSHKTGKEVPFYLEHTSTLNGEEHCWTFKPVDSALLEGVTVKIFND